MIIEKELHDFVSKLSLDNRSIIAIVGAGASVASGLKTFRGEDGYYKGKFPEELASRHGFKQDPHLVWEWYKLRIENVLQATPNQIHQSLVELERQDLLDIVITQNVDGLHRRAGQQRIAEVHGTILKTHCLENCGITVELIEAPDVIPVRCDCGSFQRPSVVWFGEGLDVHNLLEIQDKLLSAELVLIIGTSGYVHPVAQFPLIAKQHGRAKIVEFNTTETLFIQLDDLFIQGSAEITVPNFVNMIIQAKNYQNHSV